MLSPDLVPLEPESVDTETAQPQPPVTYKAELGSLTDYDTLTKALSEISQDACTADRIKEVVLYSLNSWDDFYTVLDPGGLVSFIRSILPTPFFYRHPLLTVLERLSHVRIFQLRKVSPFQSTKFTSSAFFAAMGRIMASTEQLHIEEVTFANSKDLLSFVTAFRRITSLSLLELSFKDPTTDPGLHTPPSGMPSTPAPLRDLNYSATWRGKLDGLLPVCSHYASTLRSFKLLVLPDRESNRHQNLPNISELRALETLDVNVWDNLITPDYSTFVVGSYHDGPAQKAFRFARRYRDAPVQMSRVEELHWAHKPHGSFAPSLRSRMVLQISCAPTQYHPRD